MSQGTLFDLTAPEPEAELYTKFRVNFESRRDFESLEGVLGRKLTRLIGAKTEGRDEPQQMGLIDTGKAWETYWTGLPEYVQEDLRPEWCAEVEFQSGEELRAFAEKVGRPDITASTRSIWYPDQEIDAVENLRWVSNEPERP